MFTKDANQFRWFPKNDREREEESWWDIHKAPLSSKLPEKFWYHLKLVKNDWESMHEDLDCILKEELGSRLKVYDCTPVFLWFEWKFSFYQSISTEIWLFVLVKSHEVSFFKKFSTLRRREFLFRFSTPPRNTFFLPKFGWIAFWYSLSFKILNKRIFYPPLALRDEKHISFVN